jgi:hypothetical protein
MDKKQSGDFEQLAPAEEPSIEVEKVGVSISADRKSLRLAFGGRADLTVMLDAAGVDEMLFAIAEWRGEMSPPHPWTYAPQSQVMAISDPRWCAEPEASRGGSLLHIRHYGLGWLSFWLSRRTAARLASALQAQACVQDTPSHREN